MSQTLHLGYYYVRDGFAPGFTCTPDRLRTHLNFFRNDGWEILTCGEAALRLKEGKPLPEKLATLSFDDGVKDHITTVLPILESFNAQATFFFITCPLDGLLPPVIGLQILIDFLGAERLEKEIFPIVFAGTPYLDLLDHKRYNADGRKMGEPKEMRRIKWMWNHFLPQSFKQERMGEIFNQYLGDGSQELYCHQWFMDQHDLLRLARANMEVASHTVTHPLFSIAGITDISTELEISRNRLCDVTGRSPTTFGWPFGGEFTKAAKAEVLRYYDSGWNFLSSLSTMPKNTYDLADIPRLDQARFDL